MKMLRLFVWKLILVLLAGVSADLSDMSVSLAPQTKYGECRYGEQLKEVGSTWHPVVGNPVHEEFCTICGCYADPQGLEITARLTCEPVVCPVTNCDNPVALPRTCCKICPGDLPEYVEDAPSQVEKEHEPESERYSALLTPASSQFMITEDTNSTHFIRSDAIATARLQLRNRNLYYSFYLKISGKGAALPNRIQFVNLMGQVMQDLPFVVSTKSTKGDVLNHYQEQTNKVCGVWHRIPRVYRKLLRTDGLNVMLVWRKAEESTLRILAGAIIAHGDLQKEQFSALMMPPIKGRPRAAELSTSGGTAIVALGKSVQHPELRVTIYFNGVVTKPTNRNGTASVRVRIGKGSSEQVVTTGVVHKPNNGLNVVEVIIPTLRRHLMTFAAGKTRITVESVQVPERRLTGFLKTRATCEVFQTLLVPRNTASMAKRSAPNVGLFWAYMNGNGQFVYNLELPATMSAACVRTADLKFHAGTRAIKAPILCEGLAHKKGSLNILDGKMFEALFDDTMLLEFDVGALRLFGKLTAVPAVDARIADKPLLMHSTSVGLRAGSNFGAMVWLAVNHECHLYYDVTTHGLVTDADAVSTAVAEPAYELFIEYKPIEAEGAPIGIIPLANLTNEHMEGEASGEVSMRRLQDFVSHLVVRSKGVRPLQLLRTSLLEHIKLPAHCLNSYNDGNMELDDNQYDGEERGMCYVPEEARFYKQADVWRNPQEKCEMCWCSSGTKLCEPIHCPISQTATAEEVCQPGERLMTRKGECCPSCVPAEFVHNTNAVCHLGKQTYGVGARWYPYQAPEGEDRCVQLRCERTLKVTHKRFSCPELTCDSSVAILPYKGCCKVCPEVVATTETTNSSSTALTTPSPNRMSGTAHSATETRRKILALTDGACLDSYSVYNNNAEFCRKSTTDRNGKRHYFNCKCENSRIVCDEYHKECQSRSLFTVIINVFLSSVSEPCCRN